MNKPEFFVTPGYGERNLKLFHYSQAVKIGNRLELSGQVSEDAKFFPIDLRKQLIIKDFIKFKPGRSGNCVS